MANSWELNDQASRMLSEAQQARNDVRDLLTEIARQRAELAGAALWCSIGQHAFGADDRKRTTFTIAAFDDEGQPISETRVACGLHAAVTRGTLRAQPALPAFSATPGGPPDAELYRQFLEWKNGMRPEPAPAGFQPGGLDGPVDPVDVAP